LKNEHTREDELKIQIIGLQGKIESLMEVMIQNKGLGRFAKAMEKILNEKEEKYKDTWSKCIIGLLKDKMMIQIDKFNELFIYLGSGKINLKIDLENTLLDIANYCYFLYNRLNNL